MKGRFAPLLLTVLVMGGCGNMASVQEQIEQNYTDADGLLHAYPEDPNSEYLSESIGLYLEYLLLVEDEENFSAQYEILKTQFLVQDNDLHFIRWRLKENATVNALIDDIRIISALDRAAITFGNKTYSELADKLATTLSQVQTQDDILVDFYDWQLELPAERLTLSYADSHPAIPAGSFALPERQADAEVFSPEYYDTAAGKYVSSNEVHMIDQLLIALNRERRGQHSEEFATWLIEEWTQEGKLYGRYDRQTLEATVDYESLAVYAYLYEYFLSISEAELAQDVHRHTAEMATEEMLSTAHFFDFIHYQLMIETR